jgi:hypothetical protein
MPRFVSGRWAFADIVVSAGCITCLVSACTIRAPLGQEGEA